MSRAACPLPLRIRKTGLVLDQEELSNSVTTKRFSFYREVTSHQPRTTAHTGTWKRECSLVLKCGVDLRVAASVKLPHLESDLVDADSEVDLENDFDAMAIDLEQQQELSEKVEQFNSGVFESFDLGADDD